MSSGDDNISLQIIGNSSFHEIACISEQGEIFQYDGRQLQRWGSITVKNVDFFTSIYLTDSLLYAEIDQNYYQFTKSSNFPIKISKSTATHVAPIPWNSTFTGQGNIFTLDRNELQWSNPDIQLHTSINIPGSSSCVTSFWGKPYFLIDHKLFSATPSILSYQSNETNQQNQFPIQSFSSPNALYFVYDTFLWNPRLNTKITLPENLLDPHEIIHFIEIKSNNAHSTTQQNFILFTKNHAFIRHENEWKQATLSFDPSEFNHAILQKDLIILCTKSMGIFTYNIPTTLDIEHVIKPHKLNKKLAQFKYTDVFSQSDILYFCTKNNGIFSLRNNTLTTKKLPFSVRQAFTSKKTTTLISETGELFAFKADQRIEKQYQHIPSYKPSEIIRFQNDIFYTHHDSIITYSLTDHTITNKVPFKAGLKKAFATKNKIYSYIKSDLYSIYHEYSIASAPLLEHAFIMTSNGKQYEVYPNQKTIALTTDDYPLEFTAHATYLDNPSSIEYEYSWQDPSVKKRPFRFSNTYTLKTKLIGKTSAILKLKSDKSQSAFTLAPISTTRVKEAIDYTFLIYLLGGLILCLLSIVFFSLLRNRRQKRKIDQLESQHKMIELEQKSLQMQMNPHFIFNSLNGVKGMIALGNTSNAKTYLTKISGWMRNMLNDARSSQVLLSDEVKNLDLYLDIEKELRGELFTYSIQHSVQDSSIELPSMMIQPFVENAIIHAFDRNRPDQHIKLKFELVGRKIKVHIEDNGKGLQDKTGKHTSVAIQLIKERLKLWNGEGNLYGLEIINKSKEKHGSTGVLVLLTLPILN